MPYSVEYNLIKNTATVYKDSIYYTTIGVSNPMNLMDVTRIQDEYNGSLIGNPYKHGSTITKYAFRQRFTQEERVGIDNFELSTSLDDSAKSNLRTFIEDFKNAVVIDLREASLFSGLQYLETIGLLQSGRSSEIINTPVMLHEL